MSEQTFNILKAKALQFNAAGAIVSGMQETMPVIGGDVVLLDFIPVNHIIGGYGSLYLLAERAGVQLAQSEHVQFIQDNTVFKATARYDGRPVFGEAFVGLTIEQGAGAAAPTPADVVFAPDVANPLDASLSGLAIGTLTLDPAFDPSVTSYTANTTDATNKITATAAKPGAVIAIKVNDTAHENGAAATWGPGENTVKIAVTYGTTTKTYTVIVTKA
jgi:hypothetical protein